MTDFNDILELRRRDQRRRGMPESADPRQGEARRSTGVAAPPSDEELAFQQQGISQIPDDPNFDMPENTNPRKAAALDLIAMDSETTLQPDFEKLAEKRGILEVINMQRAGGVPGGR